MKNSFTLNDFYFDLPEDQIAQHPVENRDESKLFVINRNKKEFTHSKFNLITDFLKNDDLLVFNDVKVIPARIFFKRATGGVVEVILTQNIDNTNWLILTNRTGRLKIGETLYAVNNKNITITILKRVDDYFHIKSNIELTDHVLSEIGIIPLPPYIKREIDFNDAERYQTIYAKNSGAIAAPTAGLHFTEELLSQIKEMGIGIEFLTLYVSWGTFQPVRDNDLSKHKMHSENYSISEETIATLNSAKNNGRRIISVGTTVLRVLESIYIDGEFCSGDGSTDIFITPPYDIKSIDALITNFHTPHSTLLMLVSAFVGYDLIMDAYREAVENKYRFFSYGDSMFII